MRYLKRVISCQSISGHGSLSIPPEKTRGVWKENIGLKWDNMLALFGEAMKKEN